MTAEVQIPKTPRPRTEAQRQASRENARKSRGPVSATGKHRCRVGALKHGMTGQGVVLPPGMAAKAEARRRAIFEAFRPRDQEERELLSQAALAGARLIFLMETEMERGEDRALTAIDDWDAARAAEVDTLARLLESDPFQATLGLRRTAEGCAYLADGWEFLRERLEDQGHLTPDQLDRAIALLGVGTPRQREEHAGVRTLIELADLLRPDAPTDPDTRAEAFVELGEELAGAATELVERMDDLWERIDRRSRSRAPARSYFDASPEGRLLARYMADAERAQRHAMAEFYRRRRKAESTKPPVEERVEDPPPDDPEPAAEAASPADPAASASIRNSPEPEPEPIRNSPEPGPSDPVATPPEASAEPSGAPPDAVG